MATAQPLELYYSAAQVALLLGGRSKQWVQEQCRRGEFGAVVCDDAGWLIPSSGVAGYLGRNTVMMPEPVPVRIGGRA